jgi:hypothetical protein
VNVPAYKQGSKEVEVFIGDDGGRSGYLTTYDIKALIRHVSSALLYFHFFFRILIISHLDYHTLLDDYHIPTKTKPKTSITIDSSQTHQNAVFKFPNHFPNHPYPLTRSHARYDACHRPKPDCEFLLLPNAM